MTDRVALAREAVACLRHLPQVEDEDVRIIIDVLARRLRARIDEEFDDIDEDLRPSETELKRHARDAAYWVVRREAANLVELMQGIVAEFTTLEDAAPLPDWMLFPSALSLARYDGANTLNREERDFAKALDHADFVEWWHRNPDRKPWSVRLVRGEHQNYFYPDFVICLSHYPGDAPLMRLIETKENVKDAERKARRVPKSWGKVLFLTRDQARLRVINDDGSQGLTVDYDDLNPVREWLRASRPA